MAGALLSLVTFVVQAARYETVSLCDVLKTPQAYVNKKISFRGSVYMGMENTNISDGKCPGKVIELNFEDAFFHSSSFRYFHRKIASWKMHGIVTVSGTFSVIDRSLTPFTLHVEQVTHVTRDNSK